MVISTSHHFLISHLRRRWGLAVSISFRFGRVALVFSRHQRSATTPARHQALQLTFTDRGLPRAPLPPVASWRYAAGADGALGDARTAPARLQRRKYHYDARRYRQAFARHDLRARHWCRDDVIMRCARFGGQVLNLVGHDAATAWPPRVEFPLSRQRKRLGPTRLRRFPLISRHPGASLITLCQPGPTAYHRAAIAPRQGNGVSRVSRLQGRSPPLSFQLTP